MFKELFNFKYKRSKKEAFGFYIFYFVISLIIGASLGGLISIIYFGTDFQTQFNILFKICSFTGVIYCFALGLSILIAKKLYTSPLPVILVLIIIPCTILLGALLGCVSSAILSTYPSKNSNEENKEAAE